jgi:hypothetical protein
VIRAGAPILARRVANIACNHRVQRELAGMSLRRTAYCTQQIGGLTAGASLRAIHASSAIARDFDEPRWMAQFLAELPHRF